jgi:hypothetical protein
MSYAACLTTWGLVLTVATGGGKATTPTRTYTVEADGTGDLLTIQDCADVVLPGEVCLAATP